MSITYGDLPAWMHAVASVFPLKWMAQGMRSVFLPPQLVNVEPGNSWHIGTGAIVLSLWLVKKGSRVAEGEPVVEVLGGAATVDLPSPVDGVLAEKTASASDVLAVGQRLAMIDGDW